MDLRQSKAMRRPASGPSSITLRALRGQGAMIRPGAPFAPFTV